MTMKKLLGISLFLFLGQVFAQDYPTKTIRIVIPLTPG